MRLHNLSDDFPRQYVIADEAVPLPPSWRSLRIGRWLLSHHNAMPVHSVLDRQGAAIGAVLGWPIRDGQLLKGPVALPEVSRDGTAAHLQATLSGRFAVIQAGGASEQFVLDPSGALPAVYCPRQRIVAATTGLIPYREDCGDDHDLIEQFGLPRRDGWYPFGLTPRRYVHRLLPNHRLDLTSFGTERIWPASDTDIRASVDVDLPLQRVARRVAADIGAMVDAGPTAVHLTAGRDTRMVLAGLHKRLAAVDFFTIRTPGPGGAIDCLIATELARRSRLSHRVIEHLPPRPDHVDEWLRLTGGCVVDHVTRLCTTMRTLDLPGLTITGTGGEIGRAFYWEAEDLVRGKLDAAAIVKRLGVVAVPAVMAAADRWLGALPPVTVPRLLDLLYVEQRLGCWAGPSVYATTTALPSISPFNSREVFTEMLSLPEPFRLRQHFARELIALQSPALLDLPFNRAPGWQRLQFVSTELRHWLSPTWKRRLKHAAAALTPSR